MENARYKCTIVTHVVKNNDCISERFAREGFDEAKLQPAKVKPAMQWIHVFTIYNNDIGKRTVVMLVN